MFVSNKPISLIAAISKNRVIGNNQSLPWHIPDDLKRFKHITEGGILLMGRKTWESLPIRPLSGRTNIVITRNPNYKAPGGIVYDSPNGAIRDSNHIYGGNIFVIGGGELYEQFIGCADRLYLTEIDKPVEGDTVFPTYRENDWVNYSESATYRYNGINYKYMEFRRLI